MGCRLGENNSVIINSVADLPLGKLERLQNKYHIEAVVIENELVKDEYEVGRYRDIYQSLLELTDGIEKSWYNTKKYIFVYRRVARRIKFDEKAKNDARGGKKIAKYKIRNRRTARNLDNGLIKGKSVCRGYAEILRNACMMLGVNAILVNGSPKPNAPISTHAWNQVELKEGKWIEADVTWDNDGGLEYIGNDEKRFREVHHCIKKGIMELIDKEEHATTELDLDAFINFELQLPLNCKYTMEEQDRLIDLIEERDVEKVDISQKLDDVLLDINDRIEEEKNNLRRTRAVRRSSYVSEENRRRGILLNSPRTNIGRSEKENTEERRDSVSRLIIKRGIGIHPDRLNELITYVKLGEITLNEACMIIDYKKGQIDNIYDVRENINLRKVNAKADEFERDSGYSIEKLRELGFSTDEIRNLQRKNRIINQRNFKTKISSIVEKEIEEKTERNKYIGQNHGYSVEKKAELETQYYFSKNDYLMDEYSKAMVSSESVRQAYFMLGREKSEIRSFTK